MSSWRLHEGPIPETVPPETFIITRTDTEHYLVPNKTLLRSKYFAELIQNVDDSLGDYTRQRLPSGVSKDAIELVLQWLDHMATHTPSVLPRPIGDKLRTSVSDFEWDYMMNGLLIRGDACQHKALKEVLHLADFLNIPELKDLCLALLAHIILTRKDDITAVFAQELGPEGWTEEKREEVYQAMPWTRPRPPPGA
eukprot:PhF_6_TR42389/c0_g1_i1/m.63944